MGCCESAIQPTTRIITMDHSVKDIWTIYENVRQLGQGGFGVTYEARHRIRGEIHALKLMPKIHEKASNPKETFEREVDILSSVSHPGIVGFKGAYEDKVYFAMALEFLRGGELFDRILSLKHYSEKTASSIVQDMIRPIVYLHDKNICHLDLKPENFVLGEPGNDKTIKLIDFGLALRVDEEKDDYPTCGTKIYKSPEMADPYFRRTPEVLKKADAYSFGIVLYTMLVGRFPAFNSKGNLKFPAESDLSPGAKDLLKALTEKNYIQRMSLHDALSHAWVSGEAAPDLPLEKTVLNGLKNFKFMSTFQRAVVNIVSNRLTDEDKLALKEAFTALDVNGDGKLDLSEITRLFQDHKTQLGLPSDKAAVERAKSLYGKMDQNNDGSVDVEEFMEVQVLGSLLGKDSELQMDLGTLFRVIDVNGDGQVTVDEFAAFMANFKPQEIQEIFNSADADGSGTIDCDEFMAAMSGFVEQHKDSKNRAALMAAVDKASHRNLNGSSYTAEEKEDAALIAGGH